MASHNPGPALVTGIWAAMAIAVVIVALRVFAKIKINRLGVDDALMALALVLSVTSTVFLQQSVNSGFGQDLTSLPLKSAEQVLRCIAIQVPLVTFSTTFARSSFILYLLQILGTNKSYKIALWASLLIQLSANIVSGVLPLSICRNVQILWDPTTVTTCGNTIAVVKFAYFSAAVNTTVDFFLAVFPTIVFWNLNLKARVKISLVALLSLGILAMVASIIKTTALNEVPSVTDLGATGGTDLIRWGYAENAIIIITSSVPCLRPLVMSSVRKFSSAGKSKGYELTGPFSGNKDTLGRMNSTSRIHTARQFVSRDDRVLKTESFEQILGSEDVRGITKQVDITVRSSNDGSLRDE